MEYNTEHTMEDFMPPPIRISKLRTHGVDWHEHFFEPASFRYTHPGDRLILFALKRIFDIRRFDKVKTLVCWYDKMQDMGDEKAKQIWHGIYMMGVFYRRDRFGKSRISHFFIREMDGFRGSLDRWKDDVAFPGDTIEYSVCAVLPKGYQMPIASTRDPRNDSVTQYKWESLEILGVDIGGIIDCMKDEKFKKE